MTASSSSPTAFALGVLGLIGSTSCASVHDAGAAWPADARGTHQIGISTGWAFVEAEVELDNGTGPLANPVLGGNPEGDSRTDLDPIFGLGLKYLYYVTNNVSIGGIIEHRIFDPESTRPLAADVDIDEFGSNHFILDLRYTFDAMGAKRRWRPYFGVQLGYVPGIEADGVVDYGDQFAGLGFPSVQEDIELDGDEFYTLGALLGGSYLLRDGLSLDVSAFYEWPLDSTDDELVLTPVPGSGTLGETSRFDGKLTEEGLYLTIGLSWYF